MVVKGGSDKSWGRGGGREVVWTLTFNWKEYNGMKYHSEENFLLAPGDKKWVVWTLGPPSCLDPRSPPLDPHIYDKGRVLLYGFMTDHMAQLFFNMKINTANHV